MSGQSWTKQEDRAVLAAVKKSTTIAEAVYAAQKAAPSRKVTQNSLDLRMRRLHQKPLTSFLAPIRHEAKKPEVRIEEDLSKKRDVEKLQASEADRKVLLATVEDLRNQLEKMKDIRATRPLRPVVERKRVGAKQKQGCPVMLCSDWHVEERVDPKTVAGLNEYTMEIAERRIVEMAEAFAWLSNDRRFDCREAVVWLGGDLFSGYIHEELQEKNWVSPVQAVKWLAPRIVAMLRRILDLCPSIERLLVPCNDGNHGRLTHKIRIQSRTDNSLEWLMYHQIAAMMADEKRVEFQIADGEYNYLKAMGRDLLFFHGDSVKFNGGVGGVLVPLLRGLNELRKYRHADIIHCGHWHKRMDHGEVVVNGSMIGTTPYGMSKKFSPEIPEQTWYMLDSKGKTLNAPVRLT